MKEINTITSAGQFRTEIQWVEAYDGYRVRVCKRTANGTWKCIASGFGSTEDKAIKNAK
jgi:hypothetical protein